MDAPFKAGDKVSYVGESDLLDSLDKDFVYTIATVYWCCNEIGWRVTLKEIDYESVVRKKLPGISYVRCTKCKKQNATWQWYRFCKLEDLSDHTAESLIKELSEPAGSYNSA